jgi:hypothetical protein
MSISKVCKNWTWNNIHFGTSLLGSERAPRVGSSTVAGARSTEGTCRCLTFYLNIKFIKLYYCKYFVWLICIECSNCKANKEIILWM